MRSRAISRPLSLRPHSLNVGPDRPSKHFEGIVQPEAFDFIETRLREFRNPSGPVAQV